jgi:hypothetical protein
MLIANTARGARREVRGRDKGRSGRLFFVMEKHVGENIAKN